MSIAFLVKGKEALSCASMLFSRSQPRSTLWHGTSAKHEHSHLVIAVALAIQGNSTPWLPSQSRPKSVAIEQPSTRSKQIGDTVYRDMLHNRIIQVTMLRAKFGRIKIRANLLQRFDNNFGLFNNKFCHKVDKTSYDL